MRAAHLDALPRPQQHCALRHAAMMGTEQRHAAMMGTERSSGSSSLSLCLFRQVDYGWMHALYHSLTISFPLTPHLQSSTSWCLWAIPSTNLLTAGDWLEHYTLLILAPLQTQNKTRTRVLVRFCCRSALSFSQLADDGW